MILGIAKYDARPSEYLLLQTTSGLEVQALAGEKIRAGEYLVAGPKGTVVPLQSQTDFTQDFYLRQEIQRLKRLGMNDEEISDLIL